MSYQVRFSDYSKTVVVEDQTVNSDLGVSFVGKNYTNYAPVIAENFLHLLENFAHNITPLNPVQGQLWFDTSSENNYLKIYDGNSWKAVGFIQKTTTPPDNPSIGDLWVNPQSSSKQLKMYTGSSDPNKEWILIGPEDSLDSSGLSVLSIYDNNVNDPKLHDLILLSVRDSSSSNPSVIAVISQDDFVPKASDLRLSSFSVIQRGINLPTDNRTKLIGTATHAENLIVGDTSIAADRILTVDKPNEVNEQVTINNNSGLIIGNTSKFSITTTGSSAVLSSLTNNEDIVIKVKRNDALYTALYVDSTGNIGINTSDPLESLDVNGNVKIKGKLTVVDSNQLALFNLANTGASLNVDLTAKSITLNKINYVPTLLPTQSGTRTNSLGYFIGYKETQSFLTGVWVGTSSIIGTNSSKVEQLIMSISVNSDVVIEGWYSNDTIYIAETPTRTGTITRVGLTTPYIYFYSENEISSLDYGCKLYSVLTNRSGDIATFTLLANRCTSQESFWRSITFFKITDDPSNFTDIKAAVYSVNRNWAGQK